jgi:hypothetical protein
MRVFELKPTRQKSFYKKAMIVETDTGIFLLKSYGEEIAKCDLSMGILYLVKAYEELSLTSKKHLRAFHKFCENYEVPSTEQRVFQIQKEEDGRGHNN